MRATVVILFTSLTIIGLILMQTYFESTEELEESPTDYDPEKVFFTAVQNLSDDIRRIYKKVESEESMVNVTLENFWHLARYVGKQTEDMAGTVRETVDDLDEEMKRQTEQLDKAYEKYNSDLDLIPIGKIKYENLNEHIQLLQSNTKKQLNRTKNEISAEIQKSEVIKKNLLAIDLEMEQMKDGLSMEFVEDVISEIGGKIQQLKERTENRVNEIVDQMRDRLYNMSNQVRDKLSEARQLRDLFAEVEKAMLDVGLQLQKIVDSKRDQTLATISACKNKYYSIKQRIIEFVGGVEKSISAKNSWVEDVTRQINEMSRLRVKLLTEKGETPLDYGEEVPFFGILPNETLASYIQDENKTTMTNYGVKSDGSQFIREITKEQVEEGFHIKEVFYDEEGQVRSEKSYIFYYVG